MLNALKRMLKELIAKGRYEEVFQRLKEVLSASSPVYNDIIQIEARFNILLQEQDMGRIDNQEFNIELNRINRALISAIDKITVGDLSELLRQQHQSHRAIAPEHALTCDRFEQSETFELNYWAPKEPGSRIHFYYLYGDTRQEHQSLFQRLGLDLGGFLLNWEQGDYDPGTKLYPVAFKPRVHTNPKLFKINILRELLSRFFEPMNTQQPILNKKIADLLRSPKLKDFGPNDLVFILITLDDHNWHEMLIPALVRNLYDDFCKDELPEDAPQFFFFFGIEYKKDNKRVREQVHKAIKEAKRGNSLPELKPVAIADLEEWLSRYHPLLENSGKEAGELAASLFPNQPELDMADVERILKQLIDQHNKGLIIH